MPNSCCSPLGVASRIVFGARARVQPHDRAQKVSEYRRDHVLLRYGEPPLLPLVPDLSHQGDDDAVDKFSGREQRGEAVQFAFRPRIIEPVYSRKHGAQIYTLALKC